MSQLKRPIIFFLAGLFLFLNLIGLANPYFCVEKNHVDLVLMGHDDCCENSPTVNYQNMDEKDSIFDGKLCNNCKDVKLSFNNLNNDNLKRTPVLQLDDLLSMTNLYSTIIAFNINDFLLQIDKSNWNIFDKNKSLIIKKPDILNNIILII